jgi:excisionase family DNA binding protein
VPQQAEVGGASGHAAAVVDPLYTKKTLCAYLAISPSTLDRLVNAGKLAACRVGGQIRFRPEDVEEFLAAREE